MKLTVIGSGHVGLVAATCFARMGHDVMCLDLDPARAALLNAGRVPFHEPGVQEALAQGLAAGSLRFGVDGAAGVAHGQVLFIAVGTPCDAAGATDLRQVLEAARTIGRHMDAFKVVVNKSTAPVGSCALVGRTLAGELRERGARVPFAVCCNPEFLKEGSAMGDFLRPDRIVLGCDDTPAGARAFEAMRAVYAPLALPPQRLLRMSVRSAELAKYAANAMLATRISFMNEIAALAESVGADIDQVRLGVGSDARIGERFLHAGVGYGGSCLPKDTLALSRMAAAHGRHMHVVDAAERVNVLQRRVLVDKVVRRFGEDLSGLKVAVWGLAFKPGTSDVREAPSAFIVRALLQRGAAVAAYDPAAAASPAAPVAGLRLAASRDDALQGADALLLVTEWPEFRDADPAQLRHCVVFDGRNLYDPQAMADAGVEYHGIGRQPLARAALCLPAAAR